MAFRTTCALAAAILLGGTTYALSSPAGDAVSNSVSAPEGRTRYVVAAVGDSLTDRRSHGGKFLSFVAERCPNSRFDNYGRGGHMVNQMRRRFANDVFGPTKPRYTHVIVFGGVNDLYSDLTAKRTPVKVERDLTQMYDTARTRGVKVIAINVAPWGGFGRYYNARRGAATLEVNRWIAGQKRDGKIDYVVDAYGLLSCGVPEKLCPELAAPFRDGIHFGPKGHEKIGKVLYESVFSNCE